MIANITSGNNFTGLILYNENKVQKGEAEKLFTNLMISDKKRELVKTLEKTVSTYPGKIDKPTFHVSLSLPPGERADPLLFETLANEYMQEMGYSQSPYVVYRHFDRDHDHIHIVSSRIDLDGKKISDGNERSRSQKVSRAIEQRYGFTQISSIKEEDKEPYLSNVASIANNPAAIKDQIRRVVDFVLLNLKPVSFLNFKQEKSV